MTIAAICTPPGNGGIAVIRISGEEAFAIVNKIFTGNVFSYPSHTAHLGKILSASGEVIDEVLLLVMHKGKSFTGEATVEIMCHGGTVVTQQVLSRILEAGATAAGPGEFSLKAFRNGRIDLAQAEAIQELIAAKSELALKAAEKQLSGQLSVRIKDLQRRITDITAIIEAWVDYPEEGLEFATMEEMLAMLKETRQRMVALSDTFHDGKKISEGLSICLLGAPNVGKSSLMNALLDRDRAIVTPIAGTTRDLLSEELHIGGLNISLTDTAGIRTTEEIIEKEGIRRSQKAAKEADLVMVVLDATREITREENHLIGTYPGAILIWNKTDLPHTLPFPGICISAKEHTGLEKLKHEIASRITHTSANGEILITKERHFSALQNAIQSIDTVIRGLPTHVSPEFLVLDLRAALKELSQIIGTNITEDILSAIFSKFCVGK